MWRRLTDHSCLISCLAASGLFPADTRPPDAHSRLQEYSSPELELSGLFRATRSSAIRRDLHAINADGVAQSVMVGLGERWLPAFALALGMGEMISGLLASQSEPLPRTTLKPVIGTHSTQKPGVSRRKLITCLLGMQGDGKSVTGSDVCRDRSDSGDAALLPARREESCSVW